MTLGQYISDRNIDRYSDVLLSETDQDRREVVMQLLLDEENYYAASLERLDLVQNHVRDGAARISRQKEIVVEMRALGRDTTQAEETLGWFEEVQKTFLRYLGLVRDAVERRTLIRG